MGLQIKRNEENKYQLISTFNDKRLHDEEWISEDEAKRCLIYRKLWSFIEEVIEIDMTFPQGYRVNGETRIAADYNEWILKAYQSGDVDKTINDKFEEIYKRLALEIKIP